MEKYPEQLRGNGKYGLEERDIKNVIGL